MDFGVFDKDVRRHCYLRVSSLEKLWQEPKALDALVEELQVPGKTGVLKKLSDDEKRSAIEAQIGHFRRLKTSRWYNAEPLEIFAASVFVAKKTPRGLINEHFGSMRKEKDLYAPVAKWLSSSGHAAIPEVSLGKNRVDVLGFKKTFWSWSGRSVISVELKNDLDQLKRGLDQMTTFAEYSHKVYLACTPELAAKYLWSHSKAQNVPHWEGDVLARKLQQFKFGLLLIEGEAVFEVHEPGGHSPAEARLQQVDETVAEVAKKAAANNKSVSL